MFPLYGLVLGFAWTIGRPKKRWFINTLAILLVAHVTAGVVASRRVDRMWQQKFGQPISVRNQTDDSWCLKN
jgi:hypothetical protein